MSTASAAPAQPTVSRERNEALASLSRPALAALAPYLTEQVALAGMALWEPAGQTNWVFFPLSGLVSIIVPTADGSGIEVATVGCDGAGSGSFDPGRTGVTTIGLVCIGGTFCRIAAERLLAAAEQNTEIRGLVERCKTWMLVQAQQIAACNTLHSADRRFARWLRTSSEKLNTTDIPATQEQIAGLLGVRRTTLSLIAQTLCTQGLIEYRRGKIRILDVAGLRAASCECCDHLGRHYWPAAAR